LNATALVAAQSTPARYTAKHRSGTLSAYASQSFTHVDCSGHFFEAAFAQNVSHGVPDVLEVAPSGVDAVDAVDAVGGVSGVGSVALPPSAASVTEPDGATTVAQAAAIDAMQVTSATDPMFLVFMGRRNDVPIRSDPGRGAMTVWGPVASGIAHD
jgi:hypothetical protein